MARKTAVGRFVETGGLPALALAATMAGSPAGAAQEKKKEERSEVVVHHPEHAAHARPILGVFVESETGGDGLRVIQVMEDWPAHGAGIREGDVIVSIDGHDLSKPLEDEDERELGQARSRPEKRLRALLGRAPRGEEVEVAVERNGDALAFTVVPRMHSSAEDAWATVRLIPGWLSERVREQAERFRDRNRGEVERLSVRPDAVRLPGLPGGRLRVRWDGTHGSGDHGLDLVELNPELGSYFGTEEGVLVADVEDDSSLGLRPGDVIVAVGGRRVDGIARLHRILDSYEDDEEIRLRVWRDGAETTVAGTIS